MSAIAIIPARGGSKRIPKKNVKDFLGRPIITYSIEAALKSKLFEEVMVSTDDEEIADVSKKAGASVPFLRSPKNSDDFATTADVICEVINEYKRLGKIYRHACCIYPTAPLLKAGTLIKAFEILSEKSFSTVFPIVEFGYPIWRSLQIGEGGKVEMNWPENISKRTQDLPKAYHDAGQFYWLEIDQFLKDPRLFGSNSGSIILSDLEVQDIDNVSDWRLAELKAGFL